MKLFWQQEFNFLPCPFCGDTYIQVLPQKHYDVAPNVPVTMIRCARCNANRTAFSEDKTQLEAEWNNRPGKPYIP